MKIKIKNKLWKKSKKKNHTQNSICQSIKIPSENQPNTRTQKDAKIILSDSCYTDIKFSQQIMSVDQVS